MGNVSDAVRRSRQRPHTFNFIARWNFVYKKLQVVNLFFVLKKTC